MTADHGRLAIVQLEPEDSPKILMIEVALGEDDKITIVDDPVDGRKVSAPIRSLALELINLVLLEEGKP